MTGAAFDGGSALDGAGPEAFDELVLSGDEEKALVLDMIDSL